MTISKKDFFTNNQVLFFGVSSNPKSFSRSVYKDFIKKGVNVYPINTRGFKLDGKDVYKDINQISQTPECAYVLLSKENTRAAVVSLKGKGVKKVLFHSRKTVDQETLNYCESLGMEAVVACPKMMISDAPIHKIHGFFAGLR